VVQAARAPLEAAAAKASADRAAARAAAKAAAKDARRAARAAKKAQEAAALETQRRRSELSLANFVAASAAVVSSVESAASTVATETARSGKVPISSSTP
jgi:hypothetical protein